jgi:hypothetical protein
VTIDTSALRRELEVTLAGDVRFDAVSRALYSTDASVYQIEPVGVVLPIPPGADAHVRIARFRCRSPARRRHVTAGQAIGPGLIVDISSTDRAS